MSLINDALNRAREAKPRSLSGLTPITPAESQSRAGASWLLPLLVVLLLVAACFLIGLVMARRTVTRIANKPEPAATKPGEPVAAPVAPPPAVSAASSAAVSNAVPVPSPLRLQGIVADPVHPWAILNGKTVYPGSRVDELVVKDISKNTLTLEAADGSRQQLVLPK